MNFSEIIKTDPSRLVVKFRRGDDGLEQFEWGVVGRIPILTLLGHLSRVQGDLLAGEWIPGCDEHRGVLVVVWHPEEQALAHYMDPDIPATPLVGMLETIKHALASSRMGQIAASQKVQIYGLDGRPYFTPEGN